MSKTENQSLQHDACSHAVGVCSKLLLEVSAENHLFADACRDRECDPHHDLNRALWEKVADGLCLIRTGKPVQQPRYPKPRQQKRDSHRDIDRDVLPTSPATANQFGESDPLRL